MSQLKKKLEKLKEEVAYYASAAPKVADAYIKYALGDKAEDLQKAFRQHQCETCVLYKKEDDYAQCNPDLLANAKDETYTLDTVRKAGFPLYKEKGVIYSAVIDNQVFVRGCGCPVGGTNAKWKFSFEESDLKRGNGTAPCPRNRWINEKFEIWKQQQEKFYKESKS